MDRMSELQAIDVAAHAMERTTFTVSSGNRFTDLAAVALRAAHDAGLIVYRDEYERFDEQWIITGGEHNTSPVGPFTSEAEAHAEYKRNQPQGQEYLCPPTVVRLLRPAFGRFIFGKRR